MVNNKNKALRQNTAGFALLAFITIIVVLMVIVGGVSVMNARRHQQRQLAIAQERAQFTQAEKDLNDLANKIITNFGQPDDMGKDNSCHYTSNTNEFKQGDLYCYVSITMAYPVISQEAARGLAPKIDKVARHNESFKLRSADEAGANIPPVELGWEYYNIEQLECSTGYKYYLASNDLVALGFTPVKLSTSDKGLLIELVCTKRPALTHEY